MIIEDKEKQHLMDWIEERRQFLNIKAICESNGVSYTSFMLALYNKRKFPNSSYLKLKSFFKNLNY
jgi:hypothetical protein